jgi:uncharacterized hydrophobic protein (TIGR00271 family)
MESVAAWVQRLEVADEVLMGETTGRDKAEEAKFFRRTRLRADVEQRGSIYQSILNSSHMDAEYVALLGLAGLIALFGLLENSAAVIIGAMLISPLMNPILSAALALLLGDGKLGKRSAAVLASSIAGVVGITWLVASLTPLKQATPEILARTSPNLLDLFIAFLSGLAGTLALRGGSLALTILPGVAIAVAVVPPLSVVGYGLSTRQGAIAGGAFLLFVTNLVSIIISAALVFRVMGFQPRQETEAGRWKLKYRVTISAGVLLLLSIPLFLTLRRAAIQVAIRSALQAEIASAFRANKATVSDLSFSQDKDGLRVQTTLRTASYIDSERIEAAAAALRSKYGPGTKLQVEQILVEQGGVKRAPPAPPSNPISAGVVKPLERATSLDLKAAASKTLELARSALGELLAGSDITLQAEPGVELSSGASPLLRLQLTAPQPLTGQTIELLSAQASQKMGLPVRLGGQVELRDPAFQFSVRAPKPGHPLGREERAAVETLVRVAREASGLRLEIIWTPEAGSVAVKQPPRYVAEIELLLRRSGLKQGQWTVQPGPAEGRADATAASVCLFKTFQDF